MKNPNENRNTLIAGVITAILVIWLIMSAGCAPHRPLYGPHTSTTKTNHEWDIEKRNIYSDGWQDKERSLQ